MSESQQLFGDEHVRRYRETDGEIGHDWRNGSKIALLTTKGRKSHRARTTPLIYEQDDSGTVAVVASKGGTPEHPDWYLNLVEDPDVELQIKGDRYRATAHTADAAERERWWPIMTAIWPDYDAYQEKTDREIPVVLIERA